MANPDSHISQAGGMMMKKLNTDYLMMKKLNTDYLFGIIVISMVLTAVISLAANIMVIKGTMEAVNAQEEKPSLSEADRERLKSIVCRSDIGGLTERGELGKAIADGQRMKCELGWMTAEFVHEFGQVPSAFQKEFYTSEADDGGEVDFLFLDDAETTTSSGAIFFEGDTGVEVELEGGAGVSTTTIEQPEFECSQDAHGVLAEHSGWLWLCDEYLVPEGRAYGWSPLGEVGEGDWMRFDGGTLNEMNFR